MRKISLKPENACSSDWRRRCPTTYLSNSSYRKRLTDHEGTVKLIHDEMVSAYFLFQLLQWSFREWDVAETLLSGTVFYCGRSLDGRPCSAESFHQSNLLQWTPHSRFPKRTEYHRLRIHCKRLCAVWARCFGANTFRCCHLSKVPRHNPRNRGNFKQDTDTSNVVRFKDRGSKTHESYDVPSEFFSDTNIRK